MPHKVARFLCEVSDGVLILKFTEQTVSSSTNRSAVNRLRLISDTTALPQIRSLPVKHAPCVNLFQPLSSQTNANFVGKN